MILYRIVYFEYVMGGVPGGARRAPGCPIFITITIITITTVLPLLLPFLPRIIYIMGGKIDFFLNPFILSM